MNKWYRVRESTDPKIIGPVNSQTAFAQTPVDSRHPLLSKNIRNTYVPDVSTVITMKPILEKKAILTDLISGSANGVGAVQLMISTRLKEILERYTDGNIQYFPLTVLYQNVEINSYWLTNAYAFNPEWVDFEKSVVRLNNYEDSSKSRDIEIETLEQFNSLVDRLSWPEAVTIKELALHCPEKDIFVLNRVTGGIGYYVSEKVKFEIEDKGCTGIDFDLV